MMKFINSGKVKSVGSIIMIPCDYLSVSISHPRKNYKNEDISLLSASIKGNGIIQPLIVKKCSDSSYEITAGVRRFFAAKSAGLAAVPCIITNTQDYDSIIYSLIENLQREDLHFFDVADSLYTLIEEYGMTQIKLSSRLGKSQGWISNKLRIRQLPDGIKCSIREQDLTERHARMLLKIKSDEEKAAALNYIISKKLNVKETEQYIQSILSPTKKTVKPKINKLKDIKIFINTINHAIDTMRKAGINADSHKNETDDYYEYIVRIPKMTSSPVSKSYSGHIV